MVNVIEKTNSSFTLIKSQFVDAPSKLSIRLSELWIKDAFEGRSRNDIGNEKERRPCYKITFKWSGLEEIDLLNFRLEVMLKFDESIDGTLPRFIDTWTTSEGNSYGLAGRKWFDGHVWKRKLAPGQSLTIYSVTEFINVPSKS